MSWLALRLEEELADSEPALASDARAPMSVLLEPVPGLMVVKDPLELLPRLACGGGGGGLGGAGGGGYWASWML